MLKPLMADTMPTTNPYADASKNIMNSIQKYKAMAAAHNQTAATQGQAAGRGAYDAAANAGSKPLDNNPYAAPKPLDNNPYGAPKPLDNNPYGGETDAPAMAPGLLDLDNPYQADMGAAIAPAAATEVAGLSDGNTKTYYSPSKIGDFLDKMKAVSYEYKDPDKPGAGPGRRDGIIAQDLEKSKLGKELVMDTSNGKMVKTMDNKASSLALAALSHINERINKLEKKK